MNKKNFLDWQEIASNNKEVILNINFNLKNYINKKGERQVILVLTSEGKRKRIAQDIFVNPSDWDKKKQRLKPKAPNASGLNLVLDDIESKITQIKVRYRLSEQSLNLDQLVEEFRKDAPSFDFISFAYYHIEQKQTSNATKRKERCHINKLKEYREKIPFSSLNVKLFDKYRDYLAKEKGNCLNTINTNCKTIMKYILLAKERYGYKINMNTKLIETKNIKSDRTSLDERELKKLLNYYFSGFPSENIKLSLGYFLFACNTGLRISEVFSLRRENINKDLFSYWNNKSRKRMYIRLNKTVMRVIAEEPRLFTEFLSYQKTNENIKKCCNTLGIRKNISFHVARHSFATNFLRLGGKVEELQKYLGHSSIKTTMVYVHLVETENLQGIYLLDKIA